MLFAMIHLMPIPPINSATASSDVIFWVMFGLAVALSLVATILWSIGNRRIAQKRSQVKEPEWQVPAPYLYDEQSHPAEEKVLLPL